MASRSALAADGKTVPAIRWLADVLAFRPGVGDYKIFRIDLPELKAVLGLDESQKLFSIEQLASAQEKFEEQWKLANAVAPNAATCTRKA